MGGNVVQMAEQAPVTYVDEQGNPVQMVEQPQVMYVDEHGNPVQPPMEVQPVTYVDEFGNPVQLIEQPGLVQSAPFVQAAPSAFNISPETFARLMQGGTMTPEEMAAMTGEPAPAHEAVATEPEAASASAVDDAAGNPEKKSKGSKKLKSSKKKKSK